MSCTLNSTQTTSRRLVCKKKVVEVVMILMISDSTSTCRIQIKVKSKLKSAVTFSVWSWSSLCHFLLSFLIIISDTVCIKLLSEACLFAYKYFVHIFYTPSDKLMFLFLPLVRQPVVPKTSNTKPGPRSPVEGSMIGLVLFIFYINDLTDIVLNDVYLFVDNALKYTVRSVTLLMVFRCLSLQQDLDNIKKWSDT